MYKPPRIGVTIARYNNFSPSTLIMGLKMLGMNFFEINSSSFDDFVDMTRVLSRSHTAFHLPIVSENGWDFSCLDYTDEIDRTIHLVNAHKDSLNIQHCIVHPPEPHIADELLRSSSTFLFHNLSHLDVPVYLENIPSMKAEKFSSLYKQGREALGAQLPGLCFDAPHYFISGIDPVKEFQNRIDNIGTIHISDCYKDKDVHIPFGKGGILPVEKLLRTIKKVRFSGYITLEMLPSSVNDIPAYIKSYLQTLKVLHYFKYLGSKTKMMVFWPFLKKYIAKKSVDSATS